MEVNVGYKQTEVGVIPEDWTEVRLGEKTTKVGSGITPTGGERVYKSEGRPFIRSQNIGWGTLLMDDIAFIDDKTHATFQDTEIENDDVFLNITGASIGRSALADNRVKGGNVNQHVCIIRTIKNQLNPQFLNYFLLSSIGQKQIDSFQAGGNRQGLNFGQIRSFRVFLPPTLAEQEAIAEALSDADALIEAMEQLLAKKRQVKQGAMQELLRPKENWVEKKLGNTAVLKARIGWQGLTTKEYLDIGDYYLITGTEFRNGYIDWANCHYVKASRYKQDKNIQVRVHDVLVTKDGTIGKVALITNLPKPATLNSGVFVIRPIEDAFHPEFFYYLLCSNIFTEFLSQLSAGSTINHLYQKDFVNFVYKTPPTVREQTAIADILSDMDAEIAALEAKLAKARQIKQGMMQELLTGRVRLVRGKG
jgi:type I restriction enzyme S subunit